VIIDSHVHYGKDIDGFYSNKKMILRQMDFAGIDKSVIFAFNDIKKGECFTKINSKIAKLCRKEPRFIENCMGSKNPNLQVVQFSIP